MKMSSGDNHNFRENLQMHLNVIAPHNGTVDMEYTT